MVADDQGMADLAEAFEVKSIPTLELMKIMHNNGHADIGKIKGIVDYWIAIGNCPANLHRELKKIFPEL